MNSNKFLTLGASVVGGGFMLYGLIWGVILQNMPVYNRAYVRVGTETGGTAVVEGLGFMALGVLLIIRPWAYIKKP